MTAAALFLVVALGAGQVGSDVTKWDFPAAAPRAEGTTRSAKSTTKKDKPKGYPFSGTLDSTDSKAGTITLKGKRKNRVIRVTPDTRLEKNGAKATLKDGTPGEKVSGSVRKNGDAVEEAMTIHFGEKQK